MPKHKWRRNIKRLFWKDDNQQIVQNGTAAQPTVTVAATNQTSTTSDSTSVARTDHSTQASVLTPSTRGDSDDAVAVGIPPSGRSHDRNVVQIAATATRFAATVIAGVADACPPLKSAAAGLKLILEHAATAASNKRRAIDVLARVERLLKSLEIPLDDVEENARRKQLSEQLTSINQQFAPLARIAESKTFLDQSIRFIGAPEHAEDIKEYVEAVDGALGEYQFSLTQGMYRLNTEQKSLLQDLQKYAAQRMHDDENTALRQMPHADDAGFESTDDRSRCLEETRVELLGALLGWAKNASAPQIYWLNGHAGSGKTTIAQTFAEDLALSSLLGASFFCARDSQHRSDLKMIFATLAFQLAMGKDAVSSVYRTALLRALEDHPDIGSLSLRNQLEYLIIGPAQESGLATVVIIDALDECRDEKPISTILDLLASNVERIPNIKFFITSRPEPNIRDAFRLPQLKPITEVLKLHEVQEVHSDIRVYLRKSLTKIVACRSHPDLPERWPAEHDLEALTEKSEGLFIHASTVVKILSGRRIDPQVQLRRLVDDVGDYARERKSGLNTLYLGILQAALRGDEDEDDAEDFEKTLRAVLGFLVVARNTVTAATLAEIQGQGLKESSVLSVLTSLHSLVLVPDDRSRPIRFYHKSFPDFLTDRARCTDIRFQIDRDGHEFAVAKNCLAVMERKLKRNMCGMKKYTMNETIDVSMRDGCIDNSLRYSCRHWADHMLFDSHRHDHLEDLREPLNRWFTTRLLQWLEALALLHELGQAVKALTGMRDWLTSCSEQCQTLLEHVEDSHRFTLSFFDAIQASVAHIYHSALLFVPRTRFWNTYIARECGIEARVLQRQEQHWRPLLRTAQAPHQALAVEYSHDGSMLAVGGKSFSQLFHSTTGERRAELESGCGWVQSVSFSCDDRTLATASRNSIRLWDISTGSRIAELNINNVGLTSMAFHPNIENILIAGDEDGRIYIWDVRYTSHRTSFEVEESSGNFCWLRRSGLKYILVGCKNGNTEMWDVDSPERIKVFSPPPSASDEPYVRAVASSHGGSLIASALEGGLVIYNTNTRDIVYSFQYSDEITCVAFSPTGPILAIGLIPHTVQFLYFDCNRVVSLSGHQNWVRSIAFSQDGQFVASASDDRTVNVWEANATNPTSYDEHHSQVVTSAHFSRNGELVASGSNDMTVKVWDARTGTLCTTLDGHKTYVEQAIILSDDMHVVSLDESRTLILWDWREGKLLCTDKIEHGLSPSIFPFPHYTRTPCFVSTRSTTHSEYMVCCWTVDLLHTDGPRMVLVARGIVDITYSAIVRISQRGSIETQDLMLVVECNSGQQFSAAWNDPAAIPELPQDLHFVEDMEKSPLADATRTEPLAAWEIPSDQSKDGDWILNKRGEQIMWVPTANRGDGIWYERKLVIAGKSGRLTIVDFSRVEKDRDLF